MQHLDSCIHVLTLVILAETEPPKSWKFFFINFFLGGGGGGKNFFINHIFFFIAYVVFGLNSLK